MSAILEYLTNKNISFQDIREYCSNDSLNKYYSELYFYEMEKYYCLGLCCEKSIELIFKQKLHLILDTSENSQIEKFFDCYQEILDLIKSLDIDIKDIFINNDKNLNLNENITHLDKYIENNTLKLNEIILEIPNISKGEIFNRNKLYLPLTLSEYFYDYFPYENKENHNLIKYFESEQRKDIRQNIFDLNTYEYLRKYRITGPTSNGKSFTLFFLSRCFNNIMYINLKTIKKKDKKENLKIIISELSRLSLNMEAINKLNSNLKKKVKTKENILKILLNILDNIPYDKIRCLILILDQYKSENFDTYPNFLKDLDELMEKYKELKIVTCSSINDNAIRDEAIQNLQTHKGNPQYNKANQDCLFYYENLYELVVTNYNSINYLFDNRQKYLSLFSKKEKHKQIIFEEISNKITTKLEKFRISRVNSEEKYKNYNYTFNEILIYLKSIFNEKYEVQYFIDILRMCPMKYTKIIFEGEFFIIKPIFPFIKYYINHKINLEECENYFKNKSFKNYSFQSHRIKAEYFEYSVQKGLKNNNFFHLPDKECREITLYEISKMNKIIDFNFDLLGDYEFENINENKNNSENSEEKDKENDGHLNNYKIKENFISIFPMNENENSDSIQMLDIIKEDDNNSTIIEFNNLNINNEKEIYNKDDSIEFIKELLNKFKVNQNIDEERKERFKYMSKISKIHERDIDDYRYDVINKYYNYDQNKNEIDKLVKESKINLKKFNGDENIFLNQSKENGECVDFAVLFGEKNDKTFVSFQMKCYGSNTSVDEKVKDKIYIKDKIKEILVNSMALFNCQIKHWYYYLVFYFNKNDTENNNLNYKEIEKGSYSNIAFLLYNPEEKKFYKKTKVEETKLNLDLLADLDYDDYKSNGKNFTLQDNRIKPKREMSYVESKKKFIEDLSILFKKSPSFDDIFKLIKETTKIKNNIYFEGYVENIAIKFDNPNYKYILIYMTDKHDNCYALVNIDDGLDEEIEIDYYNLKNKKRCKNLPLASLNLNYYYALSIDFDDDDDDIPKKRKVKNPKKKKRKMVKIKSKC